MSVKNQPVVTSVTVCDLCGKAVDTRGHRDWSTLNVGIGTSKTNVPERSALRFYRFKFGTRTSGAPEGDYRSWTWDFHGECLVAALEPLIKGENE